MKTEALGGWNAHAGREQAYVDAGLWRTDSLVDVIRRQRELAPDGVCYFDDAGQWSWATSTA